MMRLFGFLYGIGGTILASTAVVVALVSGVNRLWPLMLAALFGALVAVPVCWLVARRLTGRPK